MLATLVNLALVVEQTRLNPLVESKSEKQSRTAEQRDNASNFRRISLLAKAKESNGFWVSVLKIHSIQMKEREEGEKQNDRRLDQSEYYLLKLSKNAEDEIGNCQI